METSRKTSGICIIGDFDAGNESHVATIDSIEHCAAALGVVIDFRWIGTEDLARPGGIAILKNFSGLWIAPASPYKSMEGALSAIRMGREAGIPLLGTCGGFQHIVLEFARNALGIADAQHAETEPHAKRPLISRLACSLAGRTMTITLKPDSTVARLYGRTSVQEKYRCNFGVNRDYVELLSSSSLRIVGSDDEGVVRAVELEGHPFFVGTLFLPQHTSTPGAPHPLITGFVKSCETHR